MEKYQFSMKLQLKKPFELKKEKNDLNTYIPNG